MSTTELHFPARQATHEGEWVPLYLEPLPGSGERICVGVIASDGADVQAAPAPELHRLQSVYGPATASLTWAAHLAMLEGAAIARSEGLGGLKALQSRIEGLHVGEEIRRGAGRDLPHLAAIALQQASPFATLKAAGASVMEVPVRGRASPLVTAVKNSVIAVRGDLRDRFQRTYKLAERTRPTEYGFVGSRLILNFATLGGAHSQVGTQVDNAKARLWDLKHLRDGVLSDAFAAPMLDREYALLLCPPVHKGIRPKARHAASQEELSEASALLEQEADRFLLRCKRLASAHDAANEIVRREAA